MSDKKEKKLDWWSEKEKELESKKSSKWINDEDIVEINIRIYLLRECKAQRDKELIVKEKDFFPLLTILWFVIALFNSFDFGNKSIIIWLGFVTVFIYDPYGFWRV
jgi:hypothetical protein